MQVGTKAGVADNSGATQVRCIRVLPQGKAAKVGQQVVVTVCATARGSKVQKGSLHRALVVRQTRWLRRADGSALRAPGHWVVLLNPQGNPLGTRILGVLSWELRRGGHGKLLSLASGLI